MLLVTIQVDLHDQIALALQDDLTAKISSTGAKGVLIDISALEMVDSFIGRMIANISSMVKTASTMRTLGTPAPHFSLLNVDGQMVAKDDFTGKPLLVIFMCNHCPFVKHVATELARLAMDYMPRGVAIVGINSNDTSAHPEDSPEQMVHGERE